MPTLFKGTYRGEIKEQGTSKTKHKKIPYLYLKVAIDQQHVDGTVVELPAPVNRTVQLLMSEKGAQFAAQDLAVLGFSGSPSQFDPDSDNHISLVGKRADFFNNYDGEWENWRVNRPFTGGTDKESLNNAELLNLDAMFGASFKTVAAVSEEPASIAEEPAAPAEGDTEVPF